VAGRHSRYNAGAPILSESNYPPSRPGRGRLSPPAACAIIAAEGGEAMGSNVTDDIRRFFRIYQGRTSELMMQLPPSVRKELEEEIDLLRVSVLNRIAEG